MWHPIETAPKDNTPVLLFCKTAYQSERITTGSFVYGDWWLCQAGSYAEDTIVRPLPTHWMPLPSPPSE